MSLLTPFLKLFKWDTTNEIDLESEFNIDKSMNENWDKLDTKAQEHENKILDIENNIEDIQTKDTEQDKLIQKLKDNCINVTTDEATSLQVQDASTLPAKLDVRGNHSQETREGYNLWDYLNVVKASAGGLTIEKDYENGYITVNGTPNANYIYISSSIIITDMLEDGQRYTLWQEVYASEGITDGIYMQVTRTADNEENIKYYSRNNLATFKVDKSNNASYSITLQTSSVDGTGTLTNYRNRYMLYKGTDEKSYELPGASPSLDYPSEVRAVGDNGSVEIKKITENVIDLSKAVARYNTKISEIDKENGIIKVHRTNTQDPSIEINCNLPVGQYSLLHNSHNFGQISLKCGGTNEERVEDIGSEKYKTFYAEKGITKLVIYSGSELPTDYEINFSDIILVMGNVAREDIKYVKYQESSYILDIQQPMLSGDYFVKEADGWKEVHTWNKVVLTGNENSWSWNTDNLQRVSINVANGLNNQSRQMIYSNNFIYGASGNNVGIGFLYASRLYLYYPENITSLEDWKALLQEKYNSGNPVYVYYPLATPTKLACTEAQSNVLDQLNELELFKGTNNIYTEQDLALLQLDYTADTKMYIDNKIANLKEQVNTTNELLSTTGTSAMLLDNLQNDLESEVM